MQPDIRNFFNERELQILKNSTRLIEIFSSGTPAFVRDPQTPDAPSSNLRQTTKEEIMTRGSFEGIQLDDYFNVLIRYGGSLDPQRNPLYDEYRKAFGRAYRPTRAKIDWRTIEENSHPVENFLSGIKKHTEYYSTLSRINVDTSAPVDPAEEQRKAYEKAREEQNKKAEEFQQASTIAQVQSKVGNIVGAVSPTTDSQRISQLANPLEDGLLGLINSKDKLSDEDKIKKLKQLGLFSDDEISSILANNSLFDLKSNPTKDQIDEWKNKVRNAARKIYDERLDKKTKKEIVPEIKDELIKLPDEGKSDAPILANASSASPTTTLPAQASTSSTTAAPIIQTANPQLNILNRRPLITARIAKKIAPKIKAAGDITGSKVRDIVRKHPNSAMATASGFAGGFINTFIGGPYGFIGGFLAGSIMPTVVMNVITTVTNREEYPQEQEEEQSPASSQNSQRRRALPRIPAPVARVATKILSRFIIRSPYFWLAVFIIVLLVGAFLWINDPTGGLMNPFSNWDATQSTAPTTGSNIKVSKTGPTSVEKYSSGEKIPYTITVNYTGNGVGSAEIIDTIPANTSYVTSNPPGTFENGKVKWSLSNLSPNSTQTISLEVQTTADITDAWVMNTVAGTATGSSGGGGVIGGNCPTAEAIAANKVSPEACKYLNPGFDVHNLNIPQADIEAYITKYSPRFVSAGKGNEAEFRRRVDLTIQKAQQVGLNPIIILGFWKTESGFSTAGRFDHGCLAKWVNSFESSLNCAVGLLADGVTAGGSYAARCTASKISQADKDSACKMLKGIREAHPDKYASNPVTFPITTIDDYMENYGSRAPNLGDAAINRNCTHSYNLMLETIVEFKACGGTTATGGATPGGAVVSDGSPTQCTNVGEPIELGYTKKLLPLPQENNCKGTKTESCGRPGTCIQPAKIVIHTTAGPSTKAEDTYRFFAGGAGGAGTGTQFVIGKEGEVIQMAELFKDQVETTRGVQNYSDHISIEVVDDNVYGSKNEAPAVQYASLIKLVKQLMQQYNIPLGDLQYDWKSPNNEKNMSLGKGVYGHYQLNPQTKTDPGINFMRDLRKDLQ
jgi:hypothetical protein